MNDFWEATRLLEAASPENPVKLRIKDGTGQHLDILVTDATVDWQLSEIPGGESIDVSIDCTYGELE
jgi:hypothetical protein